MNRASTSLPTPDSPRIRTGTSARATFVATFQISSIFSLREMKNGESIPDGCQHSRFCGRPDLLCSSGCALLLNEKGSDGSTGPISASDAPGSNASSNETFGGFICG